VRFASTSYIKWVFRLVLDLVTFDRALAEQVFEVDGKRIIGRFVEQQVTQWLMSFLCQLLQPCERDSTGLFPLDYLLQWHLHTDCQLVWRQGSSSGRTVRLTDMRHLLLHTLAQLCTPTFALDTGIVKAVVLALWCLGYYPLTSADGWRRYGNSDQLAGSSIQEALRIAGSATVSKDGRQRSRAR